jgi:pimeloyl-ACP methyl ester carboxylesterase
MPSPTQLAITERVPEGSSRHPGGPIVVLVHGSLDRSTSFVRVVRRLGDLHTVVYDRRGYHRSRRVLPLNATLDGHIDDLLEVIDGRAAVIIGHSYGGDVALGAALRHQGGASIAGVAAYEPPMPWLAQWTVGPDQSTHGRNAGSPGDGAGGTDHQATAERFFRRMVGDAAWDRLPEATRAARRAEGPALAAELAAIRVAQAPFDVTTLRIPAVFARGENSTPRHRESVTWLVEHTPDAELIEIAGAGHGAHLTHPDAFAAMVRHVRDRAVRTAGTTG